MYFDIFFKIPVCFVYYNFTQLYPIEISPPDLLSFLKSENVKELEIQVYNTVCFSHLKAILTFKVKNNDRN